MNEFNKVDEVDVIMKKVEKIMNMLEKNSKMEE